MWLLHKILIICVGFAILIDVEEAVVIRRPSAVVAASADSRRRLHPYHGHHYYHQQEQLRSNRIIGDGGGGAGDMGDMRCVRLMSDVRWTETTMTAKLPPDVTGTWVSQRCEVRQGPKYLLRKYEFGDNHTFALHQFYYEDDGCTTPSHTVVAHGSYQPIGPSWLVPGGMDVDYVLNRVQLVAHSTQVARHFQSTANVSCSGSAIGTQSWTVPGQLHTIYEYVDTGGGGGANGYADIDAGGVSDLFDAAISNNDVADGEDVDGDDADDVDCLDAFDLVFHELQLMRVEYRRSRRPKKSRKVELLLGDVYGDVERRNLRPTSYQLPLAKADQDDGGLCAVCLAVSRSSATSPPVHVAHHRPMSLQPLRLSGEWLSTRCETRSNSMFLTRRLLFYDDDDDDNDDDRRRGRHHRSSSTWKGFYDYYVDPKCESSIFSLVASGRVEMGNASTVMNGATDVDFIVDHVKVTTHSAAMVNNLNSLSTGSCGKRGKWALGVPQEISATGGCSGLGLRVPSREREVVKMELDRRGNVYLFLGAGDIRKPSANADADADWPQRPTSYQWPLLQCQEYVVAFDYDLSPSNALSPLDSDDGIKSSRLHSAMDHNGVTILQSSVCSCSLVVFMSFAFVSFVIYNSN